MESHFLSLDLSDRRYVFHKNMSYMDTGASYTGNLSLRKLGDTLHSDINTVHRLL